MEALDEIPIGPDFDADAGLAASVDGVREDIRPIADDLRGSTSSIRELSGSSDDLVAQLDELDDDLTELDDSLERSRLLLDSYRADTADAIDLAEDSLADLDRDIALSRLLAVVLAAVDRRRSGRPVPHRPPARGDARSAARSARRAHRSLTSTAAWVRRAASTPMASAIASATTTATTSALTAIGVVQAWSTTASDRANTVNAHRPTATPSGMPMTSAASALGSTCHTLTSVELSAGAADGSQHGEVVAVGARPRPQCVGGDGEQGGVSDEQ